MTAINEHHAQSFIKNKARTFLVRFGVMEMTAMGGNDELIRERAYELWEQAGRPADRSLEFWFAATREVEGGLTAGIAGQHIVEPGVLDEEPAALAFPSAGEPPADPAT